MKLTKDRLKQIIKEELEEMMGSSTEGTQPGAAPVGAIIKAFKQMDQEMPNNPEIGQALYQLEAWPSRVPQGQNLQLFIRQNGNKFEIDRKALGGAQIISGLSREVGQRLLNLTGRGM